MKRKSDPTRWTPPPPSKKRAVVRVDFSKLLPVEVHWLILDDLDMPAVWRLSRVSGELRQIVFAYLRQQRRRPDMAWLHRQVMHCTLKDRSEGLHFWLGSMRADVHAADEQAIHYAVLRGHLPSVEALLQYGADANVRDGEIIMIAAQQGNVEMTRLLMSHKRAPDMSADDDEDEENPAFFHDPLFAALSNGHRDLVKVLLDVGSTDAEGADMARHMALYRGYNDIVEMLLARGASPDIEGAMLHNNLDMVKLFLAQNAHVPEDILHDLPCDTRVEIIQLLLDHGAKVDRTILRNLMNCERHGTSKKCELLRVLLPHTPAAVISENDDDLLRTAVARPPNYEVVKLLLDHGANVNALDTEPLRTAVVCANFSVIHLLVRRGANVNAHYGEPLRSAATLGDTAVVKLLLANGGAVPAFMKKALLKAKRKGHLEVIKILSEFLLKKR